MVSPKVRKPFGKGTCATTLIRTYRKTKKLIEFSDGMGVVGGLFFKGLYFLFFGCQNGILQAPLDPKAILFFQRTKKKSGSAPNDCKHQPKTRRRRKIPLLIYRQHMVSTLVARS
jgi:hypothetical protein